MSFERDIRPLFREKDRGAMSFAFDLSSYEDVKDNAEEIASRLAYGDMPCDEPWPQDRIDLLRRWMAQGAPP